MSGYGGLLQVRNGAKPFYFSSCSVLRNYNEYLVECTYMGEFRRINFQSSINPSFDSKQ